MKKGFSEMRNKKLKQPAAKLLSALVISAYATTSIASQFPQNDNQDSKQVSTNKVKTSLQLKFDKPLNAPPKIYHVDGKNEIVIQMTGADKPLAPPPVVSNDPLISDVAVRKVDGKVEMVVTTKSPVKYLYVSQGLGGSLVLEESNTFENVTGEYAPKVSAPQVSAADLPTEVSKVNFKKENGRNGKLTVNVSNSNFQPVVKKEDDKLIVELKNVSAPVELQRRVSTENVGTVTENIDISTVKNNTRIVLEQKDQWDYSFYQLGSQLVVEVKSSDKAQAEKRYTGKPITISFQDMDVRAILQVIADFTGLNIISSDKVTGTMTIRLKDVPWDQALDLVLEARGLQKIRDGNVIWVATGEEVTANNDNKLKLQSQNEALEPLKLEFFQINYYKADDLKNILEGDKSALGGGGSGGGQTAVRILSKRGTVGVDARNNIIFVQDTEDKLREVRRIIRKLDIANKQVLVEAKIVIAKDSWGRELGTRFGARYAGTNNNNIGINNNMQGSFDAAKNILPDAVTPMTNFAAKAINGVNPGSIGITLLNLGNGNMLNVELSALEQTQQGKVLSSPRLLTADNKKAVIEQGTEVPYVTPGSANSPATVTFKKAVLKLEVTPQISPNGKIAMELNIRKDTIGQLVNVQGGGQIPSIDTKNISTLVTVNNGQTVVLGGVYEIADESDVNKIPLLGDIPILGWLFKDSSKSKIKGELMIFITPYVVDDETLDDGSVPQKVPEVTVGKQ